MAGKQADNWPHFTLVTYSAPTGIPYGWDAALLKQGAPDGLVCEAARALSVIEDPDAGPLICFGTMGPGVYVCLDPRTQRVVDVLLNVYNGVATSSPHPDVIRSACLVNASLEQFIASVRAVIDRFPFDSVSLRVSKHLSKDVWDLSDDAWDELFRELDQAADDLTQILRRIDPEAVADPDGFWMEFVADVQMGNYDARYFLNAPHS